MKFIIFIYSIFVFGHILCVALSQIKRLGCPPFKNLTDLVGSKDQIHKLMELLKKPVLMENDTHHLLDGYLITNYDAHMTQQLAQEDRRLEYISGFVGDKGVAIVTKRDAIIWIDESEILQADEMLSCNWTIHSYKNNEFQVKALHRAVEDLKIRKLGINLKFIPFDWHMINVSHMAPVKYDLIDEIWTDKPINSKSEGKHVAFEFSGKKWLDKVNELRAEMRMDQCDAIVITALDEIAWLLNIRGEYIDHLPFIKAYLIITDTGLYLYTNKTALPLSVRSSLETNNCHNQHCIRLHDYMKFWKDAAHYSKISRRFCIPGRAPYVIGANRAIFNLVPEDHRMIKISPVLKLKAVKNHIERKGMMSAHVRDGGAFCDAMGYIERNMRSRNVWDEAKFAKKIDSVRREQPRSSGISYNSIVSFGVHSAYKYHVNNITAMKIDNSSVLLIDSGGHYLDGTTSAVRTLHYGKPTEEQIDIYTRVLKGVIDFSSMVFPSNLNLYRADLVARIPLWKAGMDYDHETGYGIGVQLLPIEGPIHIDKYHITSETFREGNFITVGPSYTVPHSFTIGLRNVLEVVKGPANGQLMFKTATLIPFEPKLIDLKLLSPEQIMWLNQYNTRVREEIGAQLKSQRRMKGFHWMLERAQLIPDKFLDRTSSAPRHSIISIATLSVTLVFALF